MSSVILSDNGVSSGSAGIKTSADSSGQLQLQTTTSGGVATTAISIDNNQAVTIQGLTVGKGAGAVSTNTAVGASALAGSNTGSGQNTGIGNLALNANTSGAYNSAVGSGALYSNTTGSNNVAVGQNALVLNTTASNNTAVGYQAAYYNTTGTNNVVVGYVAGGAVNTGAGARTLDNTTAIGFAALAKVTGTDNTGVGNAVLYQTTSGTYNTALGSNALYNNTTASSNTAVGYQAGYSSTVGGYNTFVGHQSGAASAWTSDAYSNNTFVGALSGSAITTGRKNTIIGLYNGNNGGLDIRTASNYIVLSDGDGNPRGFFDNNGTYYVGSTNGTNWSTATSGGASTITLGFYYSRAPGNASGRYWFSGPDSNSNYVVYNNNNSGVYLSYGGTSWSANSDERLKDIIEPITNAASKVSSLRAVVGKYKTDEEGVRRSFLIAQDVRAVLPEAVSTHKVEGDETEYFGLAYADVIPLLVAAIKELKAEIDTLKGQA